MAEAEGRPLADILFGSAATEPDGTEVELAEAISAWFRAWRGQVRDAASFGTPTAELLKTPRRQP
jgi:hypothetical protein